MRPKVKTTVVMSNDADGISVSQKPAAGGVQSLTITGDLTSGGVATLANAQRIGITSDGNDSGVTFSVTGPDADGITITESGITGPSSNTVLTTAYFTGATAVTISANATGNITVGTLATNGLVTKSIPVNWRQSPFNMSLSAELTAGTGGTFGMQYSVDAPQDSYTTSYSVDANWQDVDGLDPDGISLTDNSNLAFPVRAVRGKFSTGSTDMVVKFTTVQGQNG